MANPEKGSLMHSVFKNSVKLGEKQLTKLSSDLHISVLTNGELIPHVVLQCHMHASTHACTGINMQFKNK